MAQGETSKRAHPEEFEIDEETRTEMCKKLKPSPPDSSETETHISHVTTVTNSENWVNDYAEVLYRCQLCVSIPCILTSKQTFLDHVESRHFTARDTTHKCSCCELSFETSADLQTHNDKKLGRCATSDPNSAPCDDESDRKPNLGSETDTNNQHNTSDLSLNVSEVDIKSEQSESSSNNAMSFIKEILDSVDCSNSKCELETPKSEDFVANNVIDMSVNSSHNSFNDIPNTNDTKPENGCKNDNKSTVEIISDDELTFQQDYEKHARLVREGGNIVYMCSVCKVKKPSYEKFTKHLTSSTHKRRTNPKYTSSYLSNGGQSPGTDNDSENGDTILIDNPTQNAATGSIDNRTELQKTLDLILAQSCKSSAPTCIVPLLPGASGKPTKRERGGRTKMETQTPITPSMLFPYQLPAIPTIPVSTGSTPMDLSVKADNRVKPVNVYQNVNYGGTWYKEPSVQLQSNVHKPSVSHMENPLQNRNVTVSRESHMRQHPYMLQNTCDPSSHNKHTYKNMYAKELHRKTNLTRTHNSYVDSLNCGNSVTRFLDDGVENTQERGASVISSKYVSRLTEMSNNLQPKLRKTSNKNSHSNTQGLSTDGIKQERTFNDESVVEASLACFNDNQIFDSNIYKNYEMLNAAHSHYSANKYMKLREILSMNQRGYASCNTAPNTNKVPHSAFPSHQPTTSTTTISQNWMQNFSATGSPPEPDFPPTELSGLKNIDSSVMFPSGRATWSGDKRPCERCGQLFVNHEEHATHVLTCPGALYNIPLSEKDCLLQQGV